MTTLLSFLSFAPTTEQATALGSIEAFLNGPDHFLILRGAAGSGKTSIMSAVVRYVKARNITPVSLAPTGRAAKNLANKTGEPAQTLHGCLYTPKTDVEEAIVRLISRPNVHTEQQVFLADEGSLISDRLSNSGELVAERSLLYDFLRYVREGHSHNKIILIGDPCQLPPVGYHGHEPSPALSEAYLRETYKLRGSTIELRTVMRQDSQSYILQAAQALRQNIEVRRLATPKQLGTTFKGLDEAIGLYLDRFVLGQHDRVAIVSWGNEYRTTCNASIRQALGLSGTLEPKDTVVVKETHHGQHYLPNGEMGVVKAVDSKLHRVAGLTFVEAEIAFKDANDQPFSVEALVLLESLSGEYSAEERKRLFASEWRKNRDFQRTQDTRSSRYLSALQLNYGHALTVHKAQGSEWDTVIMNTWMPQTELRFLYTGITRARKELFTNNSYMYAKG